MSDSPLTNLAFLNTHWEKGAFNAIKGLRIMNGFVQGSDLLPGTVSMQALEALALTLHNRQKAPDNDVQSLLAPNAVQSNPASLCQDVLTFVAPSNANLMDTSLIFSHLLELKQPHGQSVKANYAFIETLTASERLRNQLVLDQTVLIGGKLYPRTPCKKGRPGDGYVGCVLYQIDALVTGTLGIYLSKAEVDIFNRLGSMPENANSRVCILCYSQLLTCRAGLFGVRGVGCADYLDTAMYYQDVVNACDGFQSKYMILPGDGSTFPIAPFLSFHPRQLRIAMRGGSLYVDESSMWFRPESAGFRPGAGC